MSTIKKMIIYFIILLSFFSCNKKDESLSKGLVLQEFKIMEPIVKTTIHNLSLLAKKDMKTNKDLCMVLVFKKYDSVPEFWFNLVESEDINSFISLDNLRIVGYVTVNSIDVLLLSNIQNRINFEFIFYRFFHPMSLHKKFKDVFFDENQYVVGEDNKPVLPFIPRNRFKIYVLNNGKMMEIHDDDWVSKRILIDTER